METINDQSRVQRRDLDLVVPSVFEAMSIVLVGCGAVGSQVARGLHLMGAREVAMYDPDVVGLENMHTQGFTKEDVGQNKVDCLMRGVPRWWKARFERVEANTSLMGDVYLSCVDSMATRWVLWEKAQAQHRLIHMENQEEGPVLFVDTRVLGETVRVVSCYGLEGLAKYKETWFEDQEALAERCTSKMTLYSAMAAAGLMLQRVAEHCRLLGNVFGQETPPSEEEREQVMVRGDCKDMLLDLGHGVIEQLGDGFEEEEEGEVDHG